jgi:ornithine--oxo-acid transaminase
MANHLPKILNIEKCRYLDCLSAYSAVNHGHCHPKIMQALIDQASKLTLTSRAFRNDQLGPFYDEICDLTRSHKIIPMNSGAEAMETAVKALRKWRYTVKGIDRQSPGQGAQIYTIKSLQT